MRGFTSLYESQARGACAPRGSTSQSNTAITTNANAAWKAYTRAEDFPSAATLPLQFITTKAGQKLAVLVSVPADASGKPAPGTSPATAAGRACGRCGRLRHRHAPQHLSSVVLPVSALN